MQEAILGAIFAFHTRQSLNDGDYLMKRPVEISQAYNHPGVLQKAYRGNPLVNSASAPNDFSPTINRIKRGLAPKKTVSNQKILIIAPHPDDEILCCSDLMEDRLKKGDKVKIVYITDGDALNTYAPTESRRYGNRRRLESLKVVLSLGLTREDLFFLNFPDGSLKSLENEKPITSPYTQQTQSLYASIFNHSQYTKKDLKQNLSKIIVREAPDEIYMPSPREDDHPDHQVPAGLIEELLSRGDIKIKQTPKVFHYAIHRKIPLPSVAFNPRKQTLIEFFRSQFHDEGHESFLEQFSRIPEDFTPWEPPHLAKSQ